MEATRKQESKKEWSKYDIAKAAAAVAGLAASALAFAETINVMDKWDGNWLIENGFEEIAFDETLIGWLDDTKGNDVENFNKSVAGDTGAADKGEKGGSEAPPVGTEEGENPDDSVERDEFGRPVYGPPAPEGYVPTRWTASNATADGYGGSYGYNYNFEQTHDADGDGISNLIEMRDYRNTDPRNHDTDNDGYWDKVELDSNTDPNDPESHPTFVHPVPRNESSKEIDDSMLRYLF